MPITNTHFLQQLLAALVALTISAALLIPGFLVLYPKLNPEIASTTSTRQIYNRTISGSDWDIVLGSGVREDENTLKITEIDREQNRAILARKTLLRADDYPFLNYEINNRHPGTTIFLIWLTEDEPEKTFSTQIHGNGSEINTITLANNQDWKGKIEQVGIGIYGDLRDQPIIISKFTFKPYSPQTLIETIWSDWAVFQGWSQSSINHIRGTPENPILSPTVATAAWTGLALLILASAYLINNSPHLVSYGSTILIPWIALDLLWQSELSVQLEDTKELFAGKTQNEKHLADSDSDLYQYATYLKSKVLPKAGVRIFLVHPSQGHNFTRLKIQYYLLPHNIYNFGEYPVVEKLRRGDYILSLRDNDSLKYFPDQGTLKWGKHSLSGITLINEHYMGKLYKFIEPGK